MSRCRPVWLLLAGALACGRGVASERAAGGAAGATGATQEPGAAEGNAASGASDPPRPSGAGASGPSGGDASAPDSGSASGPCLEFSEPVPIGAIDEPALDQLSGLVASRTQPGVLFAHEDSTGGPIVYALDVSGRLLATFELAGAPSFDWEDIATGNAPSGPQLFIGDIGDNAVRTGAASRDELQVIRLPEPAVPLDSPPSTQTLSQLDVLRFRYPDGEHESETLLVHPVTGDIVLITRAASGDSRVFRAPGSTPPDTLTTLEEIGRLTFDPSGDGALATAGDISPNGDRVLVRTYTRVYAWAALPDAPLADVFRAAPTVLDWAVEPQGEGITFTGDGSAWLAAGEQEPSIYRATPRCP